jgi:S-adenosylmethionine uptake transporter
MTRARPLLPFVSVATGIAIFSMMDALMKSASIEAGVYNAVLWRSAIGSAMMLPIWRLTGGRLPETSVLKLHALRSTVVAGMAMLFFWGLVRMPMAEAMAISFVAPLIALYLAAVLLGERIRARAVIGSLLGIAGVSVIAAGQFNDGRAGASFSGLLAILASAVLYAWNLILQRQQAQVASPAEVALFQFFFVGLVLALAAPWLAEVPSSAALHDIAGGAVLAAGSLMFLAWGYARAEAQALVPLEYTGFLWAVLFGWLWFAETVTPVTIAGAALIVAGCWIAVRVPRTLDPRPLT